MHCFVSAMALEYTNGKLKPALNMSTLTHKMYIDHDTILFDFVMNKKKQQTLK